MFPSFVEHHCDIHIAEPLTIMLTSLVWRSYTTRKLTIKMFPIYVSNGCFYQLSEAGKEANVFMAQLEAYSSQKLFSKLTFGTKTRLRVKEVQKMVRNEDKEKWIVGWSATTPRIGITRIQGMMTLYKDKPISLLSFKARICTLRVSQAR